MDMKYSILNPIFVLLGFVLHYSSSTLYDDPKKFDEIKFDVLLSQILSVNENDVIQNTIKVGDKNDCAVSCTDLPWCRSVNVKKTPEIDGLHICELISTDMYTNQKDMKKDPNFIHYSMETPCKKVPCSKYGVCTVHSNRQNYSCVCKRGFTGEKCEIEIDYCKSTPCLNGANCTTDLDNNRYLCTCADGFLGTNCQKKYHKESSMSPQASARTICQGLGFDIPIIQSAEENELVRLLVLKVDKWIWIGLLDNTNSNNHNNFVWIDGKPLNYTNWNTKIDSETGGCGLMDGAGLWHIHNCQYANGVGCFLNWCVAIQYFPSC